MSSTNVSWQKAAARRSNAGNRPLHASGVSILAMADIAYRKTLEFDGPLGSTWRRIANLAEPANPIIYAVQCEWLAILSFLDDQFLVVQKIIETMFPPSSHLFVKNDDLVLVIMSLPEKFDDALTKLPEIIHQFPGLECVLLYLISWLNFLVSILIRCVLDKSKIKEITIDKNTICPTNDLERTDNDESNKEIRFIPTSASKPSEAANKRVTMAASTQKRGSYKEALVGDEDEDVSAGVQKRGSYKEALVGDKDEDVNAGVQKRGSYKEALMNDEDEGLNASVHVNDEVGRSGRIEEEDSILGFFESGWTL
ncbi:uncharacterized protein LOC129297200 isoform X2 [Prosopis cineraria]|uniref:uncharacterized protein LOC129293957 isoform X2 n=1 Tax=Prosopis cineraria TaxID=364024 RepID=UPI0024106B82|nr:uncharacterized protein LOC129293957 isoform X2 [Prosopis cineraria]XP_054791544.1 uncharacterized protein LOC129297200 isoform X2 [Prosopis cineraria]